MRKFGESHIVVATFLFAATAKQPPNPKASSSLVASARPCTIQSGKLVWQMERNPHAATETPEATIYHAVRKFGPRTKENEFDMSRGTMQLTPKPCIEEVNRNFAQTTAGVHASEGDGSSD